MSLHLTSFPALPASFWFLTSRLQERQVLLLIPLHCIHTKERRAGTAGACPLPWAEGIMA